MRLALSSAGLQDWNGDVLAVGLLKTEEDRSRLALSKRFPGLEAMLEHQDFKGKPGEHLVLHPMREDAPSRLIVMGLGDPESLGLDGLRRAAAKAAVAAPGCAR